MPTDHRQRLANIRRFDQLVAYLRDDLGWPINSDDFDDLTFEYTPDELGIDAKNAAKIQEIKRLRSLVPGQPWGIFFVKFEPKRLPVVALRRILGQVALKKRASANKSERQAWAADDLLFVSNYGEGAERRIAFAHFSRAQDGHDLPTLKVLGWDNLDTPLHLDAVARELTEHLVWPEDEDNPDAWRQHWRTAFTLRHREIIATSKELSERLAELARAIRDRTRTALAIETESGPLTKLMKAFRTALVHDLNQAGFADMYAQTIAYGLLSARITDPERRTADDLAAHMRTNPFLKELMETFLHVGGRRGKAGGLGIDFDELGVSEVVDLLNRANMEAVVRDFGDRNPQEDPVIHFYEHFLAAYDKKQKVSRGVFYTPRPHSRNNQVPWIVDKVYDYKRNYPDLLKPGQAKWLQDDYVKFLRLAEWEIARSASGVLGFITNHAWLDNPTFKGMRKHLLDGFDLRAVLDLHGNANKKETAADSSPDENVFEIKQGVAISVLARHPSPVFDERWGIQRSDLLGMDTLKFNTLLANTTNSLASDSFSALPPEYIFDRRDEHKKAEYEQFPSLPSIFNQNGDPAPGIVTTHDEFAISFTREEQIEKVEALLATGDEAAARELFRLCSQKQWDYATAKRELRKGRWRQEIVPILYRPFDVRLTVYDQHVAVHRRERVSRHFLARQNIGISIPRTCEIKRGWEHVFCSRLLIQHHTVSLKEVNYFLPLWLDGEWPDRETRANVDQQSAAGVTSVTGLAYRDRSGAPRTNWDGRGDLRANYGPQDLFDWVYAVLHSTSYRRRYAEFLKSDFARVPLPHSTELFRALAELGRELVELHLLEPPRRVGFISTYTGPRNPEVGRVGWSDGTVWLDAGKTSAREGHRATKPGTSGFQNVPDTVWDFHIGGYQVCHKWLKDRKGRTLSDEDRTHYQKIVVALNETIDIMVKIDEVIETHGGWPDAFHTAAGAGDARLGAG